MIRPSDLDLSPVPSFVLTVLAVGAFAGWLTWRLWRNWSSAVRLAAAAAALVDRIAEARATAVATGETITLDQPKHGGSLPNGVRWDLPAGDGQIHFHPDGSATAESVRLSTGNRRLIIPLGSKAAARH